MLNTTFLKFPQNYTSIKSNNIQSKTTCDKVNLYQTNSYSLTNKSDNISFTSWKNDSIVTAKNGISESFRNYTFLMRDVSLIKFLDDYLKKYFPDGTHIGNLGCSDGEETRTIAMALYNTLNQITGYDISPEAIEMAKSGVYFNPIKKPTKLSPTEKLIDRELSIELLKDINDLPYLENLWNKFNEFFEFSCIQTVDKEIYDSDYAMRYTAIDSKFNRIIKGFEVADIRNLNVEKLKKLNTGVIIFKNAWYQLQKKDGYAYKYTDELDKVLKSIHDVLPENGLLVCGSNASDHFILNEEIFTPFTKKRKNVNLSSEFHDSLKKAGFEPVYYEWGNSSKTYKLPSAWKKV